MKRKSFEQWKKYVDKRRIMKEREEILKIKRKKEAWKKLYENYKKGQRMNELNRIVRRFRYFRLLRLSIEGFKIHVLKRERKRKQGFDLVNHYLRSVSYR